MMGLSLIEMLPKIVSDGKKEAEQILERLKIEGKNERLQADMRKRISSTTEVNPVFTIRFNIT